MKIVIFFIASAWALTGNATTLNYLQEVLNIPNSEAHEINKVILDKSKKLDFLKCPIELIEHQYNGADSVYNGINFLEQFLKESTQVDTDYESIHDNCLDRRDFYRLAEKQKKISRRELGTQELLDLFNYLPNIHPKISNIILDSVNQETKCYTKRTSVSGAFLLSMSIGFYEMECYTPLGRRFELTGPSFGIGAGFGTSISLPNSENFFNPLAYSFLLYERSPKDSWFMTNMSSSLVYGIGVALEQDNKLLISKRQHMIYNNDFRPAIGYNLNAELIAQIMFKKHLKPFFAKLILTNLFEDMIESAL
jgi:hypothetical protein